MRRLFILALFLFAPAQIWAEGSYYGLGNAASSGDPSNTVDRSRVRKTAKAAPRFLSASGAPTYNSPQATGLTSASGAPAGTPGNPIGSNSAAPNVATPTSGGGVVPGPGGGSTGGGGGFGLGNGSSGFGKFSGGSSTASSTQQAPKCAQGQQLVGTQCVGIANKSPAGGGSGGSSGVGNGFGAAGGGGSVPSGGGIPTVPH